MKRLVIFASGSGTNAENIAKYFETSKTAEVSLILCNNPKAKVLERAKQLKIGAITFNKEVFQNSKIIIDLLKNLNPDLIILAGFLWKIPEALVTSFPNKIINVHPALLPKYGGKGMYGKHVHEAVIANKESESGITIHYVNEHYDEGATIFQASCSLTNVDTVDSLSAKIHDLEMEHFPKVVESLIQEP
ncbi:phosphoribosylglycinamide formyltransferase [Winogradskyella aurantiaca]|uniref:phosphoribosylglycinamide formyltransferase n=1 Tax=Winogradskyella aurantiaca TaxID=2219558 RepID=UPI000E1DCDB4|nr:phosphoribosylglycinamide formyltransferase [Winogradskyella aurantiaca]